MRKAAPPLTIDVISDVVCPWCYIGKRRLERAIDGAGLPLSVRWLPFQLDPTNPPEGKSRKAYMEGKFGSAERIAGIQANIAKAGEEEGIPFAFERIEVSPNTLDPHRLIRWAGDDGRQDAVVEALFAAYFVEGRDIGDREVLADIAEDVGLDRAVVAERLASDADRAAVRQAIDEAQQIGVTGVPTFILAGRYGLVGAQPAETIAEALRSITVRDSGPAAS